MFIRQMDFIFDYCGAVLRWVFGLDPHAETSGRKQWKQEGQRALISEQKVLKMSKNHYFYRFSTLRNIQVYQACP